jgi:hypothetical protein
MYRGLITVTYVHSVCLFFTSYPQLPSHLGTVTNIPVFTFSLTLNMGYKIPSPQQVPSDKSCSVSQLKNTPSVEGRKRIILLTLGKWIGGLGSAPPSLSSSSFDAPPQLPLVELTKTLGKRIGEAGRDERSW